MKNDLVYKYSNGNANIEIFNDGTRLIEYENDLLLEAPLNIDIRVTNRCSFGYNPLTGKTFCNFCHESQRTDGTECDYEMLKQHISDLPHGIELAIGANELTDGLYDFLIWAKLKGYICNLTINQGHLRRDSFILNQAINYELIRGLGVSYRSGLKFDVPQDILDNPNTVFHVIAGIDTFAEVEALVDKGVKKILILGEKNFGFNEGRVDLDSRNHKEWLWWVRKLFDKFSAVSFDNLALQQLRIRRFFTDENWSVFNNGEHSFYVNAAEGYYAPSSRSNDKTDWSEINILEYFKKLEK